VSIRNLDGLLAPRSVALIFDETAPERLWRRAADNLRKGGFRGKLMLAGPAGGDIEGFLPTVARGLDLPETPDLAVLAGDATRMARRLDRLGAAGTRGAVILSATTLEAKDKPAYLATLGAAARPYMLRLAGPAALGIAVPGIGLNASLLEHAPRPGRMALIAQSATLGACIAEWATSRGVGFSQIIVLGDASDVDLGDLLDRLALDPMAQSILMHVETAGDARKFMSAARAAARTKPIIVLRTGRHRQTRAALLSHTGQRTGADAVYEAALARAGALRVSTLEEMFDAAQSLAYAGPVSGERVAILANGAGAALLAADDLYDLGGQMATLKPETLDRIAACLPGGHRPSEPIDLMADAEGPRYAAALEALRTDDGADAALIVHAPIGLTDPIAAAEAVAAAAGHEPGQRGRKPLVFASWLGGGPEAEAARERLHKRGIPCFFTPARAVRGFMHLVQWNHSRTQLMETPPLMPETFLPDIKGARALLARLAAEGRLAPDPQEVSELLQAFGIPVVEGFTAASEQDARALAKKIGKPVALKAILRGAPLRRPPGSTVLGLPTAEAVLAAAERMATQFSAGSPEGEITGYFLQPMIDHEEVRELICGISQDPEFGPVLLFGHGGSAVEAIDDSAVALPPLNMKLAAELIDRTRVSRLLHGAGHGPGADVDAIALLLVKLSYMAAGLPQLTELEINPVLAGPQGVVVLGASAHISPVAHKRPALRPYPSDMIEPVSLPEIGALMLRPIRPEDEPALQDFVARQPPEAVRLRFFSPITRLPHQMAARLTQIDYDREMALILVRGSEVGEEQIIGVVRLHADPDGENGEYAIMISPELYGRGVGGLLMGRMIDYARRRGITRIYGEVLAENEPMLALARRLGFSITVDPDDSALRLSQLVLEKQP
jgi:acetyltransferase